MDAVLLARIQFALTVGFHFLYPPLSIGLAWFIVWVEYRYLTTNQAVYQAMSRFWIHILGLLFAVGVATGITMEFQFGTNWAAYSRFVGDIFGAPLAAEGLFAFFLESSFLGVLLFARRRVSKGVYWLSTLLVAIGSTLSALWIIIANSWQQTPAGYHIVNGRAELTDFWAAAFNPSTLPRYTHTIVASLVAGSFFVAGICAWYLLKKQHVEFARRSLSIALVIGVIFSLLGLFTGHYHAVQVAETQPVKLAAFEGLFETTPGAPMSVFGIPDAAQEVTHFEIGIPKLLSLMVHFDPNAEIVGLKAFPKDEWPPLTLTFYSYHLMIALGMYFIVLTLLALYLHASKRLADSRLVLNLLLYSSFLPLLATQVGWIAAEVGRQPWIVYNELRTVDAISAVVPAEQILATILLFTVVYALLFALTLFLLGRTIRRGPEGGLVSQEVAA